MLGKNALKDDSEVEMFFWSDGVIAKGRKAIDSLNYSLHYASPTVWEGIRSYRCSDGSTKIFKLKEHMQRLLDSAKIMGIQLPYNLNQLIDAATATVEANGGGDLYLRPIAYYHGDAERAKPRNFPIGVDIYVFPIVPLHSEKKGITCIISSHIRGYPQYQMQAKTAANYSLLQLVKSELEACKVDDAFFRDNNGHIVEATVANLLVVKGDIIMTPPNDGSILPGITRATLAEIISDPTIMFVKHKRKPMIVEKKITRADLYTADCVMLCGTYAEVVNVLNIDGRQIGSEDTHRYFEIIKAEYQALTRTPQRVENNKE
jgi:branched-chain amino acid aminotransferase